MRDLKMGDVFELPVTAECHDGNNGWWTVDKPCGNSIDESADGGFEEDTTKAVARAINNHDRLTAENEVLQAEVERLCALWKKETERAHVAEGELLKSRVRLLTIEQERDQFKDRLAHTQKFLASGIHYTYQQLAERDAEVIHRAFVTAYKSGFDHGLQCDKAEIENTNRTSSAIRVFDYQLQHIARREADQYIRQQVKEMQS